MEQSNKIEIIGIEGGRDVKRIHSQLRSLILSIERTIPGSRGFGLTDTFIDMLSPDAVNQFAIGLEEKVDEFIAEISIAGVYVEPDTSGAVTMQIYVEWRVGYDRGN